MHMLSYVLKKKADYLPALVMIISVPISKNLFQSSEPCSSTRTSLRGVHSLCLGLLDNPTGSASMTCKSSLCVWVTRHSADSEKRNHLLLILLWFIYVNSGILSHYKIIISPIHVHGWFEIWFVRLNFFFFICPIAGLCQLFKQKKSIRFFFLMFLTSEDASISVSVSTWTWDLFLRHFHPLAGFPHQRFDGKGVRLGAETLHFSRRHPARFFPNINFAPSGFRYPVLSRIRSRTSAPQGAAFPLSLRVLDAS